MDMSKHRHAGWDATGSGQMVHACMDNSDVDLDPESAGVQLLSQQLDTFQLSDLFLGKFRMFGGSERRRGGVPLQPHCSANFPFSALYLPYSKRLSVLEPL